MKDVYKDTMDAVKAPDALAGKTLKLMLEEHKKLDMNTKADADVKESGAIREIEKMKAVKAAPVKARWLSRAALPVAACLCLGLLVVLPRLPNHGADMQDGPADYRNSPGPALATHTAGNNDEATESAIGPSAETTPSAAAPRATDSSAIDMSATVPAAESLLTPGPSAATLLKVEALAMDNLATRSGPGTQYRETGTYTTKGEAVGLISLAYDEDGLAWAQCEVPYGNKLRRVYTGAQRFDGATFDLAGMPAEAPLNERANVAVTSKAMYGPGDGYDTYAGLTVDEGQTVTVIAVEKKYAQVEWTASGQRYRAWVPVDTLRY